MGGYPNAAPLGPVIQEFDASKELVWQWRYYDHFGIEDSPAKRLRSLNPDLVHANSVEPDEKGNLIVSGINAEFIFKINRQTGDVLWVLGGIKNMFSFVGADSTEAAGWFDGHAPRLLENGNLLFLDNNDRGEKKSAHVCEWKLDEENLIAELVWEYIPDPAIQSVTRGNANRLPNGNTFIGWGAASENGSPVCSEVTPEGQVVFELYWNQDLSSYRAFRQTVDTLPAAEMTAYEVLENEIIEFIQGDTLSTGISLQIDQVFPGGYNEINVKSYHFAAYQPKFPGQDPLAYPYRILMTPKFISSLSGKISFDIEHFHIKNPQEVTVYTRPFEGQGLFLPLATVYNPAKKRIVADFNGGGEFILTWPDYSPVPIAPLGYEPAYGEKTNTADTLNIKWSPFGFINSFDIQIATDQNFENIIDEVQDLEIPLYEFTGQTADRWFYWRVKTQNEAGESEWSQTMKFFSTESFIQLHTPSEEEKLVKGQDCFIRWEDNIEEDLIISLFKEGAYLYNIDTVPSNGAYMWTVSPTLENSDQYHIQLSSTENPETLFSSGTEFSIFDDYTAIGVQATDPIVSVFPNPAQDFLVIEYFLSESSSVSISLIDMQGREVGQLSPSTGNPGYYSEKFMLNGLKEGVYILKFNTGKRNAVRRIVIGG